MSLTLDPDASSAFSATEVSELSETLCIGPPWLLVAGGGGADAADVDALEAADQAMAAFCKA